MSNILMCGSNPIGQVSDLNASNISYNNTSSGLTASDVQAAIDEINLLGGGELKGNLTIDTQNGTTTEGGLSRLFIGNATPTGTAGNTRGELTIYAPNNRHFNIVTPDTPTASRSISLPDKAGTLAVTSEVEENVYRYTGMLLNASPNVSSNIEGYGVATISLRNGIARIDLFVRITQNSDTTEVFNYGINRDLFKSAIGNIEITPVEKGVFTFYNSSGVLNIDRTGYGGSPENINRDSQFWGIGRMHNIAGTVGGWPTVQLPVNTMIVGTIYGTY